MAEAWRPPDDPIVSQPAAGAWRPPDDPIVSAQGWQPPDDPIVAAPRAGILDYLTEAGKQFGIGAVESAVATPLRGVSQPEPGMSEMAAIAGLPQPPRPEAVDLRTLPTYQAGEAVSRAIGADQPSPLYSGLPLDVIRGAGSVAGSILTSPFLLGAGLQQGGEAAQRAVQRGATPEQQREAQRTGGLAGPTEFADLLLLSTGSAGRALSAISRIGLKVLQGAAIEGGQEGVQQVIQNAISRGVYDPNQSLGEDVPYSMLVGAIVGGGAGGVMPGGRRPAEQLQQTIEGAAPPVPEADPLAAAYGATVAPIIEQPPPPPQLLLPPPAAEVPIEAVRPPRPDDPGGDMRAWINRAIEREKQSGLPPFQLPTEEIPVEKFLEKPLFDEPTRGPGGVLKTKPSVNVNRLAPLLSSKLYGSPATLPRVTMKEMFQNSFDAIKDAFALGMQQDGNIDIQVNPEERTMQFIDDGKGMTPETLAGPFLDIAGTEKVSNIASGGLGIAKMLVLSENGFVKVTTMRNGVVSEMGFSGPDFKASFSDPERAPEIITRQPTRQDKEMFPKGHGTRVAVQIPETYVDTATGQTQSIGFPSFEHRGWNDDYYWPVMTRSPLLQNINVRVNGRELPMGSRFPLQDFTPFANMPMAWGTARVIVSANEVEKGNYGENVHVLSNGIWQFSQSLKAGRMVIPRDIYIDVSPKVSPTDPGYPFELNRQGFAPAVRKDFDKIFNAISLMYQQVEFNEAAENFGGMQFLTFNRESKRVEASGEVTLKSPTPPPQAIPRAIKKQNNVITVKEGELLINGQKVPELSTEQIEAVRIDAESLKIPQDQIPNDRVVLHDNQMVNPTGGPIDLSYVEPVSMTEYGYSKFGERFYDYIFLMGNLYMQLREVVATFQMPPTVKHFDRPQAKNYSGLLREAVGISFDQKYRGVSIRVPFSGSFVNPFNPIYEDPVQAGLSILGTMIHEFAHHGHRSEELLEPVVRAITIQLDAHPTFNMQGFKQKVINVVAQYHDIVSHMRGLYEDGYSVPRGKRLEVGNDQAGDGGRARDLGESATRASSWGRELSHWVAASQAGIGAESRREDGGVKTSGHGDPSFGQRANQRAINREVGHSDVPAYQRTAQTQSARQAINAAGVMTPQVAAQAAHADHINWLYKWGGSLLDLTQRNLRFTPLVRYTELARQWHMIEARVQDAGVTIAKRWRSLGTEQSDALTNLFDDLTNMLYLTPTERAAGVVRNPTQQEFNAIANRYKVGPDALRVYTDVRRFFTTFLRLTADNAKAAAQRTISDPNELAKALTEVDQWITTLEKRPYFPFLRFGSHYIHAKDANGHTVFFGLYERKGVLSARQVQLNMLEQVRRQFPTANITDGVMPEDVRPFYGMPPSLLKMIHQKMNLTPAQIDAIEQLTFQMSPEMSFRHRFQHKSYTPGYSRDFIRAFSHYAFHGARYYAKTKHVWDMEDQIKLARAVGGDKATRIANFMEDHLQNTMLNIRGDYGLLKGIAFNWHLAFMPSSAFVNMTQTPLVTGPFLANKFGNTRATRTMVNVMRKLNNYYRKGSYQGQTEFDLRALGVGMLWGVVSETQASELAALGNGNGLILGIGGTKAQQTMQWFQQKGAMLFEGAEQFNRRIAFRSALELAMNDQTNKYVDEAVAKNPTMYNDLINGVNTGRNGKFTPQEARAIVTAFDAVEQTQFVYSRFARPRFMRGKWSGALFVFQRYTQGILFLMLNENRGYKLRYLLAAAMLGGLGGLLGYEELKDLFEGVMGRFFGKHVNVDAEVRKYVKQFTGNPEAADYILHGWMRRGLNVAHILDAMGSFATGRPGRGFLDPPHMGYSNVPVPQIDMSKSVTTQLLPIQAGKLLNPFQDPNKVLAEQGTRAAGAAFSIPINMYKALTNTKEEFSDRKRWEKAMPRVAATVSKTFRAYSEGRERFGSAAPESARTLVKYDARDPEQMMEIIFKGMGFNPLRESQEWDFTRANLEHKQFVQGTRKLLMEQMFEALRGRDRKEIESVKDDIRKYNERVRGTSDRGYAITEKGLEQSMATRARELGAAEAGLSGRKREVPVIQELREIYPRAVEIQRR